MLMTAKMIRGLSVSKVGMKLQRLVVVMLYLSVLTGIQDSFLSFFPSSSYGLIRLITNFSLVSKETLINCLLNHQGT